MAVRMITPKAASNAAFDLTGYIMKKMQREFNRELRMSLGNILRTYIDNPIKGDITKEKLKAANIQGIIRRQESQPLDIDTQTDKDNVIVRINSDILGFRQGNTLIMHDGRRMPIDRIPVPWYEEHFIYE